MRLKRSSSTAASKSASAAADPLAKRFEEVSEIVHSQFEDLISSPSSSQLWRDRTPIESELDELVAESRLTWSNDHVFNGVGDADDVPADDEDGVGAAKKRRRLGSKVS